MHTHKIGFSFIIISVIISINCYAVTEEVSLREKDLKSLVNEGVTLVKERKAVELRKAIGQSESYDIDELMEKISDSVDTLYEYKIPDKPKNLPIGDYKRIKYGILVKPNLSKDEYKYIFYKFLFAITSKDNDIDEIDLLAYDNEDALDYFYNVASIEWCPQADLETKMKKIAYSNNRTDYRIAIEWADKYSKKFEGLIKLIEYNKSENLKSEMPKEFIPIIEFNSKEGHLSITDYLTKGLYKNKAWEEEYYEHDVYLTAENSLKYYVLPFPEIKKYDYTIIWKGEKVFTLSTDRNELDSLNIDKIFKEFDLEATKQEGKRGFDKQEEEELESELYYRKIFSHFSNLKIYNAIPSRAKR